MKKKEKVVKEWFEEKGKEVFKPNWPTFLTKRGDKVGFLTAKSIGMRLSNRETETLKRLKELGFEVEIAIVTEGEDVICFPFDEKDIRVRIPQRLSFGRGRKRATKEVPFKPFNPLTDMPTKKEIREIDKEQEEVYEEYLKIFPKQKEVKQAELIEKMEAQPEESPQKEGWVRKEQPSQPLQPSQEEDEKIEERERR